ncbi:MAG: leucine--tRNA ligase [Bdellovibrionaceae bacterium]|nr:leucine--tRNA ligase [Pseudobdellovibrionaceae bacterium]
MNNSRNIEKKWQALWAQEKAFEADPKSTKPKYYALDMFPYPSGSGLHVGHAASYMPTEVISRYKRAKGFNVLHPMGYDAFGLPAEQYAIQTGIHPAITTEKAIGNFRRQLQCVGLSFDWSREISTADPKYYKWTQFIFTKLFERGLAYQKEVPVNWCPALKTVLANEEVVDGKSERGGHPVIRMPMKQWMLKITDYAERLLNDLDMIDWPERTREGQKNWIGKSEGARVHFPLKDAKEIITVFTTRPDTLFGATFMVLAPENPVVLKITTPDQAAKVQDYIKKTLSKSEVDRKANTEKTGQFTGAYAVHPLTQKPVPIWISDYVLNDYGTGAIMAVPAHDQRDFEFAQAFGLDIVPVLQSPNNEPLPFEGDGILINSDFLNGLDKKSAIQKMNQHLEATKKGEKEVQYKLRDWLFSRQRYWGEPFPMVRFSDKGLSALPVNELPVILPEVADYEPTEKGEPPLARVPSFLNYTSPQGHIGTRETDTMPGSAGSSWYFLRFTDPHNDAEPFSQDAQKYWMPVDLYVGGPEHTVGHLLYARFWHKVLFDVGLVSHPEPFKKLAHQGMILGKDGEKMSKSRGNVEPLEEVIEKYGADTVRTFICFLGPMDKDKAWSPTGVEGVKRFLERVGRLVFDDQGQVISQITDDQNTPMSDDLKKSLHKTIKKVTHDIETMGFNTAISQMMILVNEIYKQETRPKDLLLTFSQLLMPFAPHLAEEIWQKLGGKGFVSLAPWPNFDEALCKDDKIVLGVQVNGKMRGTIELSPHEPQDAAVALAMQVAAVANAMGGKLADKIIYKEGKILNLIVK